MKRFDIINKIIENRKYSSYLEIGVKNGNNIKRIKCKNKIGVDVISNKYVTHHMSSDKFFQQNNDIYDIIFIDGLHESEQVYKDIINALNCLSKTGTIVCHDMKPENELMQRVPRVVNEWTGDCWKAWIKLRTTRNDLSMAVVDTDYGCGIIRNGTQKLLNINNNDINYENFNTNQQEWLNLISVKEFLNSWL